MGNIQRNILILFLFFLVGLPSSYFIIKVIYDYFDLYSFTHETIFFTRSSCDPQESEPKDFALILMMLFPFVITYILIKIIQCLFFKYSESFK